MLLAKESKTSLRSSIDSEPWIIEDRLLTTSYNTDEKSPEAFQRYDYLTALQKGMAHTS
jgi:hypothetical protein